MFRLPKARGKFFVVLNYEFDGALFGFKDGRKVKLTVNVVPMGWLSAVGVIQHLHRQLAMKTAKSPREVELRRDAPLPLKEDFTLAHFWELYIDNFDECEPGAEGERGTPPA